MGRRADDEINAAMGPGLAEILAGLRDAGDEPAWARFIGRAGPLIRNACRRELPGTLWIEDAIQEALLAIQRGIAGYRGNNEAAAVAWIGTVSANAARQIRRREHRRPQGSGEVEEVPHQPSAPPADWIEVLARCLHSLPDKQQQALRAVFYEGQSYSEVATALQTTPAYVANLVHRALMTLRGRIGRDGGAMAAWAMLLAWPARSPMTAPAVPRGAPRPFPVAGVAIGTGLLTLGACALWWGWPAVRGPADAGSSISEGILIDGPRREVRDCADQPLLLTWIRPPGDPVVLNRYGCWDDPTRWLLVRGLSATVTAEELIVHGRNAMRDPAQASFQAISLAPVDLTRNQAKVSLRLRLPESGRIGVLVMVGSSAPDRRIAGVGQAFGRHEMALQQLGAGKPSRRLTTIDGWIPVDAYLQTVGVTLVVGDSITEQRWHSDTDPRQIHLILRFNAEAGLAEDQDCAITQASLAVWPLTKGLSSQP